MIPRVRFGRTGLDVTRLALGGYPFGGVNKARGWDPFTAEGRKTAIATIHAALEAGINYIDTAPSYGKGNSEAVIGEATRGRRDQFHLATKVSYNGLSPADVTASVHESLNRLQTDHIDVIQFHGGMYTGEEVNHILNEGLIDALDELREKGLVRFIGFTVEEPWTARPLVASGQFDMFQVRYNIIYQAAAHHVLDEAAAADMGIAVMRPMTSGVFQRMAGFIAPDWAAAHDLYETALKFVLGDSRVHVVNVGMRFGEEVARNAALAESWAPEFDTADLPRMTAEIYRTDDEAHGFATGQRA